jgi:cyanophycin synthetase
MKLAEIRDLDGPNLFLLRPAIKVELILEDGETESKLADRLASGSVDLDAATRQFFTDVYDQHEQPTPQFVWRHMDEPGHVSLAFAWVRRRFAMAVAQLIVDTINGVVDDNIDNHLNHLLNTDARDEFPECVLDADRSAIAISVTGTNGKTTTTRLIAHLMQTAGYRTGWNSSSGIYIDGEEIEAGDYSGPSGARRVLEDPSVQAAVLETARGGILLRGLGYEHNDVSVFTNVSADHLDLQGVRTLETLAEVKAVVCKVTRPQGVAVVNADDPLVMVATADIVAQRTLFTQRSDNDAVASHLASEGRAILADRDQIVVRKGDQIVGTFPLAEIPMTFGGRARHMVENAMAGIGAALGAGLGVAQIRAGLQSFRNDSSGNLGRMNIYTCNGITIVLDFAHNEAGLAFLVDFGRSEIGSDGRLITIIGTAGDRTEHSLREIGHIAAERSDIVIAKGTHKYLRGRTLDDLMALYRAGANQCPDTEYHESESEVSALEDALRIARSGDVIVLMAQEYLPELTARLKAIST